MVSKHKQQFEQLFSKVKKCVVKKVSKNIQLSILQTSLQMKMINVIVL